MYNKRIINLEIPSYNAMNFLEIYRLPQVYLNQALNITQHLQKSLSLQTLNLELDQLNNLISEIPGGSILNTINQSVEYSEINTTSAINNIMDIVKNNCEMFEDDSLLQSKLESVISNVFLNLANQEKNSYVFYHEKLSYKTSYSYHVIFVIDNMESGLSVFPISFNVNVDSGYENLHKNSINDLQSYKIKISGINFMISKNNELTEIMERVTENTL